MLGVSLAAKDYRLRLAVAVLWLAKLAVPVSCCDSAPPKAIDLR
jgi:hypothetical protein